MNSHIFREYDIRGVVDQDLTPSVVEDLGRGFGTFVMRRGGGRVAMGWDCRLSSPSFAELFATGLVSTGVTVVELGMIPTPVLYFESMRLGTSGAVQITGSHNPKDYNGFKLVYQNAPVYGAEILEIRRIIEEKKWVSGEGSRETSSDAIERYIQWVTSHTHLSDPALRVVLDGGNGMAGPTIVPLLERLGVKLEALYCDPDGRFPNHHPDPTLVENLERLGAEVVARGADLGVGYDGDADRLGVVDERGRIIWGDRLMILFSRAILKEVPGATIVGEVKCSQTLFDDIRAHGGNPIMWKVGHSLIKAKMKETGAELAGEMSGHIFFKHRFFGFDDALYSTVRLLEILQKSEAPLSSLLEGVPESWVTPELRLDMPNDSIKFRVAEAVASSFKTNQAEGVREVLRVDGVRVVFDDGWGLIRASNTQPVLVMRAEANTKERRDAIEEVLRKRVHSALEELKE